MNSSQAKSTSRLHLQAPFLASCNATVIEIDQSRGIVLDRTPAYARGGGQEGDHGVIQLSDHTEISFNDTRKGDGRRLTLTDFPNIPVETMVYHQVAEEDIASFKIGMEVRVKIDINRRARLTVSHSGLHLVLMGLEKLYPEIYPRIIGCQIKETGAKLDFSVDEKMSQEDIAFAESYANELIAKNLSMATYPHDKEPEAYYWKLENTVYPCGGTHLETTNKIGRVTVAKKNMGKGKQRVSFKFPNAVFPVELYYDE